MHGSTISIVTLRRHAPDIIDLLADIILHPTFPPRELAIHAKNKKQQHEDNLRKTPYLARQAFLQHLHGPRHPYANPLSLDDFDNLTLESVQHYYRQRLAAANT
ncbi:MAG: insulinase family protein, partial [Odoribacteraceae bacterium]|nr:insulinase family protein [Odoribacteraceae bacterium]